MDSLESADLLLGLVVAVGSQVALAGVAIWKTSKWFSSLTSVVSSIEGRVSKVEGRTERMETDLHVVATSVARLEGRLENR